MDWDNGSWTKVPDEWNEMIDEQVDTVSGTAFAVRSKMRQSIAGTDFNPLQQAKQENRAVKKTVQKKEATDEARDERMGVFEHHSKGLFHTFLFVNQRNTRLFFDETDGQWVRMPLSWERNIPEVQTMLGEIDASLPHWKNVNEQLLTLRECNYEVADAIAFGEINFGFEQQDKSGDKLGGNILRTARRRTTIQKSSALIGVEGDASLGRLSTKAAKHIADLEKELADAQKRLDAIDEEEEERQNEMRSTQRRATMALQGAKNLERSGEADEQRTNELTKKVNDQRLLILELEKSLAEAEAAKAAPGDGDEVETLRKKLAEKATAMATLKAEAEKYSDKQMAAIYVQAKELLKIKNEMGSVQVDFNELEDMFSEAIKMTKKISENTETQVRSITSKYRAEVVLRKQLYNTIQELRGNIRVYLRCRPDNRLKPEDHVMEFPDANSVIVPSLKGQPVTLEFNQTYGPDASQAGIFEHTKPVVMSVVDGCKDRSSRMTFDSAPSFIPPLPPLPRGDGFILILFRSNSLTRQSTSRSH